MLRFCTNWPLLGCGLVHKGEFLSYPPASIFSLSVSLIAVRIHRATSCTPSFVPLHQKQRLRIKHDPDLEMDADNNGDGNVTTPELEVTEIVVHNGNGENSQEDPDHASQTSEQLPGNGENLQDRENGENLQLGIYKLYALSQAGIFAAPSSTSKHFKWSRFMLSGLVTTAIIVILLIQFCQQFRQRQGKEYSTWVAQKAAIVVMLVAVSLCLLVSFTP